MAPSSSHSSYGGRPLPDAMAAPFLYDGITLKRCFAYGIDLIILAMIGGLLWLGISTLSFMTLGLAGWFLWPLAPLVPLAYHTLLIIGPRGQTIGMRLMGIEVCTLEGSPLSFFHAVLMVALFYLTLTFPLLLAFTLFNSRRRALHDIFSGTLVINSDALR
ncbi:RDD family protein [Insolitispirillum peregrinum]|uniref:Uncharacterized membrane protein YckC, RDD family n=1 Tax=Insolitispirillum peregrinum TaxID=80876 RepID=A0A1N7IUE6_9PROT|nr:RDD family protein [Insolitispirillum peregrinum]SIS40660.1 Uncharacterized membrane protein YckC, RDD family [Insolitispirillum peregrinum]